MCTNSHMNSRWRFSRSQRVSIGRKIRVDESDTALVEISLFEPSRSLGKEALRSAFSEQVDGL